MESNPFEVGKAVGESQTDSPISQPALYYRCLRLVGLASIIESFLIALLVLGSLWYIGYIGLGHARNALTSQVFRAYLVERFIVLPAFIALTYRIGLGIGSLERRSVLTQVVLSLVIVVWASILTLGDYFDLRFAIEEFWKDPGYFTYQISLIMIKYLSGASHFVISLVLFRMRRYLPSSEEHRDAILTDQKSGFVEYVFAFVLAIVLVVGTVGTVNFWTSLLVS